MKHLEEFEGFKVGDTVRATGRNQYAQIGLEDGTGIVPGTEGTVKVIEVVEYDANPDIGRQLWPLGVVYHSPEGDFGPYFSGLDEVEKVE